MNVAFAIVLGLQYPTADVSAADVLAQATAASVAYQNNDAALRAGYRRIGPDTPEMGQHWIQLAVFVDARLDYTKPTVLTFANIDGKPTLAGVAYALPLAAGEEAPPLPAGLMWHEHAGSIHSELVGGVHRGMTSTVPRLAMLHVWTGVPNPAGTFMEENWALPFVRLGLVPPPNGDLAVARAVSLATVGESYFTGELARILGPESVQPLQDMVARARERVRSELTGVHTEVPPDRVAALSSIWRELVDGILLITPKDKRPAASGVLGEHLH